jgi:hypothetical protein
MALTAQVKGRQRMGRFLEIARGSGMLPALLGPRTAPSPPSIMRPIPLPPMQTPAAVPPFDAPASAVLQILVVADQPVPHPEIVRRMLAAGHDKTAACQAIARCQKRRWIEHDLTAGYVISSD